LQLRDPAAHFDYSKFYYKNADYVFGVSELKTFAGKFAYLYADMLCFLNLLDSDRFRLTPEKLYGLARSLTDIHRMNRPRSRILAVSALVARMTAVAMPKVVLQEPKALCGKPESVDLVLVETHLSLGFRPDA